MKRLLKKWNILYRRHSVMVHLLLSYALVSILLLCLLSTVLISIVTNRTIKSTVSAYQTEMRQTAGTIEWQLNDLYKDTYHIFYNNPVAQAAMLSTDLGTDALLDIRQLLADMLQNDWIDSVYFVNMGADAVFSSRITADSLAAFNDADAIALLRTPEAQNTFTARHVDLSDGSKMTKMSYITLCFALFDHTKTPVGGMIVNLDRQSLQALYGTQVEQNGAFYLLDRTGQVLLCSDGASKVTSVRHEPVYEKMQQPDAPNYFVMPFAGEKGLITYVHTTLFDMTFLQVTPYRQIVAQADALRGGLLAFSCLFVLAGLVLSVLFAGKIYAPLYALVVRLRQSSGSSREGAMNEYEYLHHAYQRLTQSVANTKEKEELLARQKTLLQLVTEDLPSPDSRQSMLARLGLSDGTWRFRLLVMHFDKCALEAAHYTAADSDVLCYGLSNMMQEVLNSVRCEELGHDVRGVQFLLMAPADTAEDEDSVLRQCGEVAAHMARIYGIQVHAGLSESCTASDQWKTCLEQALTAVEYGALREFSRVIPYRLVAEREENRADYPQTLASALLAAISQANAEAVDHVFEALAVFIFRQCRMQDIPLYLLQLAQALGRQIAAEGDADFSHRSLSAGLLDAADVDAQLELLKTAVVRHVEAVVRRRDQQKLEILSKARAVLEAHCFEPDLSIENILQDGAYSVGYIRKLFKEYCHCTPNDYVLRLRMTRAQQLLRETDATGKEIAAWVGYATPLYFYNVFKKYTGQTTQEYREQFGQKKGDPSQ